MAGRPIARAKKVRKIQEYVCSAVRKLEQITPADYKVPHLPKELQDNDPLAYFWHGALYAMWDADFCLEGVLEELEERAEHATKELLAAIHDLSDFDDNDDADDVQVEPDAAQEAPDAENGREKPTEPMREEAPE